jgi:peptidoglycan/LPS O-acetylase OafA/YrhL
MQEISTITAEPQEAVVHRPIKDRLKSNNFDGLRLIFASMVVVFHIGILSQAPILAPLYKMVSSLFAVQAFFVVSGFLVTMSFEGTRSVGGYFRKRILRIFPAYITCVTLAAVLLVFLSELPVAEYFTSAEWRRYVVLNLMLSNFAQPTLPGVFTEQFEPIVNGSLWTIKLEVLFYCAVPFIVWAVRRFGYVRVLACIFVGSICWNATFRYLGDTTGSDFLVRLAKQLPGQMAYFAGGAWAFYRTREGRAPMPAWAAMAGAIIYAVSNGITGIVAGPICVTMIVYWAAIAVPRLWGAQRWGDFSYGLYLYHFPIAQSAIALGLFSTAPLLGFCVVIAISVLVAICSWHLLEKPALRFAHRRAIGDGASAIGMNDA